MPLPRQGTRTQERIMFGIWTSVPEVFEAEPFHLVLRLKNTGKKSRRQRTTKKSDMRFIWRRGRRVVDAVERPSEASILKSHRFRSPGTFSFVLQRDRVSTSCRVGTTDGTTVHELSSGRIDAGDVRQYSIEDGRHANNACRASRKPTSANTRFLHPNDTQPVPLSLTLFMFTAL